MRNIGDETHFTEEEASGGIKPHILRYMLAVSLILAIAVMSAVWIIGSINA